MQRTNVLIVWTNDLMLSRLINVEELRTSYELNSIKNLKHNLLFIFMERKIKQPEFYVNL